MQNWRQLELVKILVPLTPGIYQIHPKLTADAISHTASGSNKIDQPPLGELPEMVFKN